jgi:8-oxo-dGTP diphosphatase
MEKHIKIGCEIFIIHDGKILLGKRKNAGGAGSWGLPGGHPNYGEKLIDAARRELREELDIDNADLFLTTISDDPREDQHYVHFSFLLKNFNGKFRLMEPEKCEEWKFFPLANLPENVFYGHITILKTFLQNKLYIH